MRRNLTTALSIQLFVQLLLGTDCLASNIQNSVQPITPSSQANQSPPPGTAAPGQMAPLPGAQPGNSSFALPASNAVTPSTSSTSSTPSATDLMAPNLVPQTSTQLGQPHSQSLEIKPLAPGSALPSPGQHYGSVESFFQVSPLHNVRNASQQNGSDRAATTIEKRAEYLLQNTKTD